LKASISRKNFLLNRFRIPSQKFLPIRYFTNENKPHHKDGEKESSVSSKYKEAFEDLKTKLHSQPPPGDDKMASKNDFDQVKDDLYRNYKYADDPIDPSKKQEAETAQKVIKEESKESHSQAKTHAHDKASDNTAASQSTPESTQTQTNEQNVNRASIKDRLANTAPFLGKVADFVADSWEQTFPSEKYHIKAEIERRKAKERAEKEKVIKEYTEEELVQLQEEIPEWKRTAIAQFEEESEEDNSLRKKVSGKIKESFNQTTFAKTVYQTEQFKEYTEFKKEMSQFKEDLKDHLSQSQNPAVIASMAVYSKATSESSTAQAIKEMRKFVKNFDVFDLERDARGIFCDVFNAYLKGDLDYIEKTCEDAARAYFKTLLKKREVDGVYPKHQQLWESEPADFVGGRISERNLPCFTFTIRIQEIHCNISKKTEKIVDGADDRVLQNRYNFVLSPHENPDLEVVGHQWVITEVIPVEAVHMLA